MAITFNYVLHQQLWDWLSKHPEAEKKHWLGWDKVSIATNLCFACEYDYEIRRSIGFKHPCCACPLDWGNIGGRNLCHRWECSTDLEERRIIAEKIRDACVKPGVNITEKEV